MVSEDEDEDLLESPKRVARANAEKKVNLCFCVCLYMGMAPVNGLSDQKDMCIFRNYTKN